jgi:hypothetical protein
MQITLPLDLTAKTTHGTLSASLNKQPQAGLDRGPLCPRLAAAHSLAHQAIVDLDVCPHLSGLFFMCKSRIFLCTRQSCGQIDMKIFPFVPVLGPFVPARLPPATASRYDIAHEKLQTLLLFPLATAVFVHDVADFRGSWTGQAGHGLADLRK